MFFTKIVTVLERTFSFILGFILIFTGMSSLLVWFPGLLYISLLYPSAELTQHSTMAVLVDWPSAIQAFFVSIVMHILAVVGYVIGFFQLDISVGMLDGKHSYRSLLGKQLWRKELRQLMSTQAGHVVKLSNLVYMVRRWIIFTLVMAIAVPILGELGVWQIVPVGLFLFFLTVVGGFMVAISELDGNLVPIQR